LPGALTVVALAGCDGGRDFGTNVTVTNGCGVDLAVAFLVTPAPAPTWNTTDQVDRLTAGASEDWLLEPLTGASHGVQYMWVTTYGSPSWGEPVEIDLGSLPEEQDSGGSAARLLVIEGEFCPS
jgi:heme/copper-type cytochrome/quinol oxidase subunit 2